MYPLPEAGQGGTAEAVTVRAVGGESLSRKTGEGKG